MVEQQLTNEEKREGMNERKLRSLKLSKTATRTLLLFNLKGKVGDFNHADNHKEWLVVS